MIQREISHHSKRIKSVNNPSVIKRFFSIFPGTKPSSSSQSTFETRRANTLLHWRLGASLRGHLGFSPVSPCGSPWCGSCQLLPLALCGVTSVPLRWNRTAVPGGFFPLYLQDVAFSDPQWRSLGDLFQLSCEMCNPLFQSAHSSCSLCFRCIWFSACLVDSVGFYARHFVMQMMKLLTRQLLVEAEIQSVKEKDILLNLSRFESTTTSKGVFD